MRNSLWVPELDSGNHITAQAPASFPHPLFAFGVGSREEASMRVGDPITEEAVRDVGMLLAIAYERYATALPARLEIAADSNADPLDNSGSSSRHGQ
jgi:hypothetical protein